MDKDLTDLRWLANLGAGVGAIESEQQRLSKVASAASALRLELESFSLPAVRTH